jgi:hypothetical protein
MATRTTGARTRLSPQAYEALAEALAVIHWNITPHQTYLRRQLSGHPDLLARLDFTHTKRVTASTLVALLQSDEKYDSTALIMMLDIAEMTTFPNLARQPDADERIRVARDAVRVLAELTARYRSDLEDYERGLVAREAARRAADATRLHNRGLDAIKDDFLGLHQRNDAHARGRDFERLLHRLFELHDMEPRLNAT